MTQAQPPHLLRPSSALQRESIGHLARPARGERGVVLVEAAIVLPVVLLVLLSVIAFGMYITDQSSQQEIASEAARMAAVNGTVSQTSLASQVTQLGSSGAQVYLYYPSGSTGATGQSVRACVTSTFNGVPMVPWLPSTVWASATMRIEQARSNWTVDTSVPSSCPTS